MISCGLIKVFMFRFSCGPRVKASLDILSLFGGRMGGILVTLFFIPRYHSLLGGEAFGAVSIILSLQAFFLVSDLGLATLISRDTAIARDDPDALAAAVWMRRRAEAVLSLTAAAISAVALMLPMVVGPSLSWSISAGVNVALAAPLIMVLVLTNIVQLCLNALGAYQASAIMALAGAIARGGATVWALTAYPTLSTFLQAQLVTAVIYLLVARSHLERCCGPAQRSESLFHGRSLIILLKRCAPLFMYTLASSAAVNLDKVIVSQFISVKTAGVYFLATTYAFVPVAVLSGPINSYFAPRVAYLRYQHNVENEDRLAVLFQTAVMCSVIGPSLSLGFQSFEWLQLWLGDIPKGLLDIAPILLAGGAISATGYYPTTYLIAAGESTFLARLSLACGFAVLAAGFAFAFQNDLMGFAWSYFAFYVAGFVGLWARLGALRGWRRLVHLLIQAYALPATLIAGAFLIGRSFGGGYAREVQLLLPLSATAAVSLAILAVVFSRNRQSVASKAS